MTRLWEKKWTDEKVIKTAIKFKSFKTWVEKDKKSYAAARARKLLNEPRKTKHLIKISGLPIYILTKDKENTPRNHQK